VIFAPKYVFRVVFEGGFLGGARNSLLKQYDRTVWCDAKFYRNVPIQTNNQLLTEMLINYTKLNTAATDKGIMEVSVARSSELRMYKLL